MLNFHKDDVTATNRHFPLFLVDATDGITAETGESGGQPQLSKNGAAFGNTSATLTAVGNGHYYVVLTAAELDTDGYISVRYKSANTTEFNGIAQVVASDPYIDTNAKIDAIGGGSGGALNFANEGDNVSSPIKSVTFVGVETSGTNASINNEDGVYHQIDDTGNAFDIVYQFDIGGGRTAVTLVWKGYLNSSNDSASIQVYNGSSWETIHTINGQNGSSNVEADIPLLTTHTGISSDLGKVFIRFVTTGQSNPTLYTDQLVVEAINIGQTIGYALGAIWVDTVNGVAGTEPFVNGVADNPVLTWADALTLAAAVGLKKFDIATGSTITLSANSDNDDIIGVEYNLDLNGQSIAGAYIEGAIVTGTGVGANAHFEMCSIGTASLAGCRMGFCRLNTTLTLSAASDYYLHDCWSGVAGSGTPVIDFGAAVGNTNLNLRRYSGGVQINNKDATGTDLMSLEGNGQLIVASTSGGAISVRGNFKVTNTGGATITYDDNAAAGLVEQGFLSPATQYTDNIFPTSG
jgi:hypothetical protein